MVSSHKNIAVWGDVCTKDCRDNCDAHQLCGLCKPCVTTKLKNSLFKAHSEYLHRSDFRRLYPPLMKQNVMDEERLQNLSVTNRLQYLWYQGKCNQDVTWCT